MTGDIPDEAMARTAAAVGLIGRTGAKDTTIAYFQGELPVTVWVVVATYPANPRSRNPAAPDLHAVAAGLTPVDALDKMLDQLIDGGTCEHCHRPTAVHSDHTATFLGDAICWYTYDPELRTYRRSCEGTAP